VVKTFVSDGEITNMHKVKNIVLATVLIMTPLVSLAAVPLNSFTQAEIDTWTKDRTIPSGGYSSVSFGGRTEVLELNIDTTKQAASVFYRTEGIQKTSHNQDVVSADLYIDSTWIDTPVRAGMWGVAATADNTITSYPIIEFTTQREDGTTGWRIWDVNQWKNIDTNFTFDTWQNVSLVRKGGTIEYYIGSERVGKTPAYEADHFSSVIFNSYNYGVGGTDYSVHWHAGDEIITNKSDCKTSNDLLEYKNQGQCVQSMETN